METSSPATDEDSPTAAGRPRESMHSDGHSQTAAGEYSSLSQDEKNKRNSRGLVPERTTASECAAALSPIGGFRHLNKLLKSLNTVVEGKEGLAFVTAPPRTKVQLTSDARKSTAAPQREQSLVRQRSAPIGGHLAKPAPPSRRMRSTSIAPEQFR